MGRQGELAMGLGSSSLQDLRKGVSFGAMALLPKEGSSLY